MTGWFWGTPQWASYCAAYPQPVVSNDGPFGNMVVSLDGDAWKRVRKGHRAQIRKTERTTSIIYDTDGDHLDVFQGLHLLDAGRITRPQATWDIMRDWLPQGYGLLVIAVRDHLPIGGGYFIRYRGSAYYASAARDPNFSPKESPAHLIVWSAMTWLRERGYKWLDLGPVDPAGDAKVQSIEHFKRGFGPTVVHRAGGQELVTKMADYLAAVAEKELA